MPSKSKEDIILRLILENSPLKEWHFEEIKQQANVTKAVANKWIKKYISQGIIKKITEKGKYPYYTVGQNNTSYIILKKIYALEQIQKTGLMKALVESHAKTIILFGSMAKGDWYKDSDIDIFILGNLTNFNRKAYEDKLNRSIELHIFENKNDIKKIKTGLLQNIVNGYLIKGEIQELIG